MAKVTRVAKLQLPGGQAKPGPELAGLGIDMGGFTKQFNDATRDRQGDVVPVIITAYDDRSFEFVLKTTPAPVLIKKAAGVKSGAAKAPDQIVGSITIDQLREIAEHKMEDLNTDDIDAAISMLKGTCVNMGIEVLEKGQQASETTSNEEVAASDAAEAARLAEVEAAEQAAIAEAAGKKAEESDGEEEESDEGGDDNG